jgi:hypothetical protein
MDRPQAAGEEPGGDINALKDTQIDLGNHRRCTAAETELVLNDEPKALATSGAQGTANFQCKQVALPGGTRGR